MRFAGTLKVTHKEEGITIRILSLFFGNMLSIFQPELSKSCVMYKSPMSRTELLQDVGMGLNRCSSYLLSSGQVISSNLYRAAISPLH